MMSAVGKLTCSGFKTVVYMFHHGGNDIRFNNQEYDILESCRMSDYFDTKYTKVVQIELALQKFEDWKIGNFFNLE